MLIMWVDQVVNYEVVLADGSIVEANATTNSDLFRALKGGSNNFGIVSRPLRRYHNFRPQSLPPPYSVHGVTGSGVKLTGSDRSHDLT